MHHWTWECMMTRSHWIPTTTTTNPILPSIGRVWLMHVMNQWLTLIPVAHLCDVQKKWFSKNSRRTKEQAKNTQQRIESKKTWEKNRNHEFRVWYAKAKLLDRSLCVVVRRLSRNSLVCQIELINDDGRDAEKRRPVITWLACALKAFYLMLFFTLNSTRPNAAPSSRNHKLPLSASPEGWRTHRIAVPFHFIFAVCKIRGN